MRKINTYDIDGVINLGDDLTGLIPGPYDVIITGRSVDEASYTLEWLYNRNITNNVMFNHVRFHDKSREKSGHHKADSINALIAKGYKVGVHFEDDEVQAKIIEVNTPIKVVRIVHDLVEKENVWHGNEDDAPKNTDCDHEWRSLWNDYYSWGSECSKCGVSASGDY